MVQTRWGSCSKVWYGRARRQQFLAGFFPPIFWLRYSGYSSSSSMGPPLSLSPPTPNTPNTPISSSPVMLRWKFTAPCLPPLKAFRICRRVVVVVVIVNLIKRGNNASHVMHDEPMPLLHAAIYPRQAQQRTVVQDRARALPARAETIREGLGGDLRPSPDPLGPPDPHPRPEVLPQRGEGAAVPRKRETRRGGSHRAPSSRLGVGGLFVWLPFGFKLLDSRRHRRRRRRR